MYSEKTLGVFPVRLLGAGHSRRLLRRVNDPLSIDQVVTTLMHTGKKRALGIRTQSLSPVHNVLLAFGFIKGKQIFATLRVVPGKRRRI